ncbi:MAG TPA: GDP-mannose 4,6-dehydratase [bacterium]|nr:GDP-mannose 4,6-dehydratase [bacterium]HOL48758.1 GDP-mannose 4,6-dehydratase [bacterium]HPQ19347.1 GDP-mannose 4,6-dehydratase [bacterium]
MEIKNKIILVTGGTGFIGSHLIEKLLKEYQPAKVIAYDNFCASKHSNIKHLLNDKRFELVVGDVRDFDVLEPIVEQSEIIFHLAASKLVMSLKRPRIDLETNIIGVFNILQLAKKFNKRVIHASTGSVLGSSDKPMPEDYPCSPTTLYGITKHTAERYCLFYYKEFGVKVTIIRYFHVYGPRQDYLGDAGVVNIFISRVLNNKPLYIYGTGEQIRCFTYVEDDVDATILMALKDETIGEIYNVASRNRISVKELAEIIIKKYGNKNSKYEFREARPGENLKPIPDTTKIEKFGWTAKVNFEEGLERTKNWIVEEEKR